MFFLERKDYIHGLLIRYILLILTYFFQEPMILRLLYGVGVKKEKEKENQQVEKERKKKKKIDRNLKWKEGRNKDDKKKKYVFKERMN